jgi:ATP-dependent Clp protease protease subunit
MKKQLNGIYQKHTGQTLERLQDDTDRDRFMSASEALDYGIIDTVISSQNEIVSDQVIKAQAENRGT